MPATVVWFRRDLRLDDHAALRAAAARGPVVPLFVLDPRLLTGHAPRREAWLAASLAALAGRLRRAGARLVVRRGDPRDEVPRAAVEVGADAVLWHRDYTPFARARDDAVARACRAAGLEVATFADLALVEPETLLTGAGRPYTVFTPYHRAWASRPIAVPEPAPARLIGAPGPGGEELARHPAPAGLPVAGEAAAMAALDRFVEHGLAGYGARRDRLDLEDATSGLSPYLRFGALSPRRVLAGVRAAVRDGPLAAGAEAFVRQLAWRDFFVQVLYHAPVTLREALRPARRAIAWRDDGTGLRAWQEGRTGYPAVDAGMRQLGATGVMSNRARLIAASFLAKHLLIHWRAGERWFMKHLLDGDPALNTGNWQWVASTGADAMPAFRIFNPVAQGMRFDPQGEWVRRWVPELAGLPGAAVHAPWTAGGAPGYPAPIVEHAAARARALRVLAGRGERRG